MPSRKNCLDIKGIVALIGIKVQAKMFVELKLFDSVLYKDNIKYRKNHFQQNIYNDSSSLEFRLKMNTLDPSIFNQEEIDELIASIKRNREILSDFVYIFI